VFAAIVGMGEAAEVDYFGEELDGVGRENEVG
jgi:hypothetical protein